MLTSNELKYYSSLKHKKFKEREKKFLIEGRHLVEECLKSSYCMEVLFVDEKNFKDKYILTIAKEKKIRIEKLKSKQIDKLSETKTPPGIIGVVHIKENKTIDLSGMSLMVALDSINDPGNLGTIIRTAYWYGVDYLLVGADSVDIYNPKVVRSSQGAIFHINFATEVSLMNELKFFRTQGFQVYALTTHTKRKLNSMILHPKSIFLFGSESAGLSDKLLRAGFENVKIDGFTECESLNIAVTVGIALDKFRNK
jgi:TrmH family RNA methyltransferase